MIKKTTFINNINSSYMHYKHGSLLINLRFFFKKIFKDARYQMINQRNIINSPVQKESKLFPGMYRRNLQIKNTRAKRMQVRSIH